MATPRRPNFTKDELKALIDGVNGRQKLLFSSFNNTDTHVAKERGWQQIVQEVNAVSETQRTKDEIRRKWTYVKSETKKKNSEFRKSSNKTGGGPADQTLQPDETELVVLGILGPTALEGISGGVETADIPLLNQIETVLTEDNNEASGSIKKRVPFDNCTSITETGDNTETDMKSNYKQAITSSKSSHRALKRIDEQLLEVEKEKLEIEKERLIIEKRRLKTEEDRLEVEKKRLKCEEDKNWKPKQNIELCSPWNSQSEKMLSFCQL